MGISSENDPFQRIIDASWQDVGTQYVPTEGSYNDSWPEDQNGHVLSKHLYEKGLGLYRYRNRRGSHTCTPPLGLLKKIMLEIDKDKTYYDDMTAAVQASRAGVRADANTVEIDDNPTTPDGFYDFTDYRTGHTD